jgi:hypothetical protein
MKRRISPFIISIAPGTLFSLILLWLSSTNEWGARRFTLFDDAMISMSYAKTLVKTGEFVWFADAPRVEGFTNPLWTLWMSLIHLLGLKGSSAALAISLTGLALLVATAWLIYDLVENSTTSQSVAVGAIAAGSSLFIYPTLYWTLRGMEVGVLAFFTAFLVRTTVYNTLSPTPKIKASIAIIFFLGVATRFDFVIICAVVSLALTAWSPREERTKTALTYGLIIVASLVAVCGIQKVYWGSWFPNTYHLKIDGVDLFERLSRGLASGLKVSVLGVIFVFVLLNAPKLLVVPRRTVALSISIFMAMAAYSTYIGGDAWEDQMVNRFFATCLPLVPLVIFVAVPVIDVRKTSRYFLPSLVVASLGYGATVNPFGISTRNLLMSVVATSVGVLLIIGATRSTTSIIRVLSSVAVLVTAFGAVSGIPFQRHLRNNDALGAKVNLYVTEVVENLAPITSSEAVVATVWAGVPAYYSDRSMIDLLGKNDVLIASSPPRGDFFPGHNKWDYNYSIGQLRPDVIFQTFTRGLETNLQERIREWGYEKYCTSAQPFPKDGVYFRVDSTRINRSKLVPCRSS